MPSAAPTRLLFVCTGNICRSPLAACLLRHKAEARGVGGQFVIESAGTGSWHVGEPPDRRMQRVAQKNAVALSGTARQVTRNDFDRFDFIICMDESNREHLETMGVPERKLHLLLEFDPKSSLLEVPDPYSGGQDGFETVYRIIDSACDALLDKLTARAR